jgi:hypothetical protein
MATSIHYIDIRKNRGVEHGEAAAGERSAGEKPIQAGWGSTMSKAGPW